MNIGLKDIHNNAEQIKKGVNDTRVQDPLFKSNLELVLSSYEDIKDIFKKLIECDHVYEILPFIQENTCTKGRAWIILISLYFYLIFFIIMLGISFKRFDLLIQKKVDELKVIF